MTGQSDRRHPSEIEEIAERVADKAAKKAVSETFGTLGVDISSPEDIRHFQANMAWIFRFRRLSEKVGQTVILTIVGLVIGALTALTLGKFGIKVPTQ